MRLIEETKVFEEGFIATSMRLTSSVLKTYRVVWQKDDLQYFCEEDTFAYSTAEGAATAAKYLNKYVKEPNDASKRVSDVSPQNKSKD